MEQPPDITHETDPARSFGQVADAYDRARPSYPEEAAQWLVGPGLAGRSQARILELGAGTGKLTEQLCGLGHRVVATDPSEPMLRRLRKRAPQAATALAAAESIPLASRSVDVVIAGQAFHWFDTDRSIPEIARVLRPGGTLALVWNERDERIPWVKRLGRLIGSQEQDHAPGAVIDASGLFEAVESATFRFWQPTTRESLGDLVLSRSNIAVQPEHERSRVLDKVEELYNDYGRGADGMLLPYVTFGYRATVKPQAPADEQPTGPDDLDTDSLLIDFR